MEDLIKQKNISGIYSLILTATAFVVWGVICICEGKFSFAVIKYSLLFGIFYTIAMVGTVAAFLSSAVFYFCGNRCSVKDINKKTVICPVVGGISSAALNLLILLLIASSLSESIIFPGIAVGGLGITTIFSVIAYKEKMSILQWSGLMIGVVALILLNV